MHMTQNILKTVPVLILGRVPILNLGLAYNLQSCNNDRQENKINDDEGNDDLITHILSTMI